MTGDSSDTVGTGKVHRGDIRLQLRFPKRTRFRLNYVAPLDAGTPRARLLHNVAFDLFARRWRRRVDLRLSCGWSGIGREKG